jgi:hypothetical protein
MMPTADDTSIEDDEDMCSHTGAGVGDDGVPNQYGKNVLAWYRGNVSNVSTSNTMRRKAMSASLAKDYDPMPWKGQQHIQIQQITAYQNSG